MAGASRHDNPESPVPFNVAVADKGPLFYGNRQFISGRKAWPGKSVAVLDVAI